MASVAMERALHLGRRGRTGVERSCTSCCPSFAWSPSQGSEVKRPRQAHSPHSERKHVLPQCGKNANA
eukprot:5760666-Alexandrium_andersonii.AAC.1